MPSYLLDVTTRARCAHRAKAAPTVLMPRVTVLGKPVVTQPFPYAVVGCLFTPVPGGPPVPCVAATWVTASLRVTTLGQPLLLTSSRAITAPNGVPVTVTPGQTRVEGL